MYKTKHLITIIMMITLILLMAGSVNAATTVTNKDEFFDALLDSTIDEVILGTDIEITDEDYYSEYFFDIETIDRVLDFNGNNITISKDYGSEHIFTIRFLESTDRTVTIKDSTSTGIIKRGNDNVSGYNIFNFDNYNSINNNVIINGLNIEQLYGEYTIFDCTGSDVNIEIGNTNVFVCDGNIVLSSNFSSVNLDEITIAPNDDMTEGYYLTMNNVKVSDIIGINDEFWIGEIRQESTKEFGEIYTSEKIIVTDKIFYMEPFVVSNVAQLNEAINAPEVKTIQLGNDITVSQDINIIINACEKILDLNGKTLTIPEEYKINVYYKTNHEFIIRDTSSDKNGTIFATKESTLLIAPINYTSDSIHMKIESGNIKSYRLYTFTNTNQFYLTIEGGNFKVGNSLVNFDSSYDSGIDIKNMTLTSIYESNEEFCIGDTSAENISGIINSDSKLIVFDVNGNKSNVDSLLQTNTRYDSGKTLKVIPLGFEVNNIYFNNLKEGYESIPSQIISILNETSSAKTVNDITVSGSDFEITPSIISFEISAKDTNTDYVITPKTGLSEGLYEAIITVTDSELVEYTANVNLCVVTPTVIVTNEEELINALSKGSLRNNIILGDNINVTSDIIWSVEESEVSLDLNGYTLDLADNQFSLWIYEDSKITIFDSSNSTGKILGNISDGNQIIAISDESLGNKNFDIIINGGTYENKEHIYGNLININGDNDNIQNLIINNGTFINYAAVYDGSDIENVTISRMIRRNTLSSSVQITKQIAKTNDILGEDSEIYYYNTTSGEYMAASNDDNVNQILTYVGNDTLIRYRTEFKISVPTFENVVYGYASVIAKDISIYNKGTEPLQIKSIELDEDSNFEIGGTGTPTVDAGVTNTEFNVKPKDGLNVGFYSEEIIITDANDKKYIVPVSFTVNVKDITSTIVIETILDQTYTGSEIRPTLVVKDGENLLTLTEDYTVDYTNNINKGTDAKATLSTVSKSNYTWTSTVEKTFNIVAYVISDNEVLLESTSGEYTGKGIEPTVKVTVNGNLLTYGTDYDVTYENNINVGTEAKLIITGKGNYEGIVEKTFEIVPKVITPLIEDITTIVFSNEDKTPEFVVIGDSNTLVKDKDYEITYENNKYVGAAVAVIKAKKGSNYTWTDVIKDFTINPATSTLSGNPVDVTDSENTSAIARVGKSIDISDLVTLEPNNYQDKVTFTVIDDDLTGVTFDTDGKTLKGATSTGTVAIKALFSGMDFNDDRKLEYSPATDLIFYVKIIENEKVIIDGLTYSDKEYDGTVVTPTGTLTVLDNKVPVNELVIKYEKFETSWVEIAELSADAGKYRVTYSVSDTNDIYVGTKSYEFEITKATPKIIINNLSQKEGNVIAVKYTVTPEVKDGTVKVEYKVSTEEDLAYTEILPTTAGTYTVKVSVVGDTNLEDTQKIETLAITKKTTGGSGGGGATIVEYIITVKQNDNGKISPETIKVEKGDNQKFEIKADEGYEVENVLVDGKSVGAVKEYTFENVKAKHTIEATFKKVEVIEESWKNSFKDVTENDWYYEAVKYANENKLFKGISETEFGPNVNMTRGMLVTVLYRLAGEPETNKSIPFADVDMSMYYANAISWAKQNNIVNGVDGTNFAPNAQISREQLVTILYRYAKLQGNNIDENANISSYDDANEVSSYATPALKWAVGAGIIAGRTETTIVPQGTATRAEVATMLMRFDK